MAYMVGFEPDFEKNRNYGNAVISIGIGFWFEKFFKSKMIKKRKNTKKIKKRKKTCDLTE